jgi:FkbM family methyltransferase
MLMFANTLLSYCVERVPATQWCFKLFSRILPIPTALVRGVPIKAVIPLNQFGVYAAFRAWESREPETLDWIDSFEPDCTFFDVGAGFGTETLYAALKRNGPKQIASFDLDLVSSFDLAYNLYLNRINKVEQFYVAVGSTPACTFVRTSEHTNYFEARRGAKYERIGCYTCSLSLDTFSAMRQLAPDYVKIDVDGAELDVVRGMHSILKQPRLKSVLIELCAQVREPVLELMNEAGFRIEIESGFPGTDTKNVIFYR